jgi:hypothetical protein
MRRPGGLPLFSLTKCILFSQSLADSSTAISSRATKSAERSQFSGPRHGILSIRARLQRLRKNSCFVSGLCFLFHPRWLPGLKSPGGSFSSGLAAFDAALEQLATFVAHECAGREGLSLFSLTKCILFSQSFADSSTAISSRPTKSSKRSQFSGPRRGMLCIRARLQPAEKLMFCIRARLQSGRTRLRVSWALAPGLLVFDPVQTFPASS